MQKLNIHYLQHVPFENPGCILDWVNDNNHHLTSTKFYESDRLPHLSEIDWLIVMGGPMGVYDEDIYPWLSKEKAFIKEAIDSGKTVIGICLGSQLIAEVLGAKVYANQFKEIGWFDISLTQEGKENHLFPGFESSFKVFHWHGDTFDLPANSVHLAFSEACKNQAFLYNNKVLGLQFHFEVTADSLSNMLENGNDELVEAAYVQSEQDIKKHQEFIAENNQRMYAILDTLQANVTYS